MSATFAFHLALFEHRAAALAALEDAGFCWLEQFSAVDLDHENYGLEVCGIHQRADAEKILGILRRLFPAWRYVRVYYRDYERDCGWKVTVQRDPERATAW